MSSIGPSRLSDLPVECVHKIINSTEDKNKVLYKFLFVNKWLHEIAISLLWRNPAMYEPIIKKYINELNEDEQKALIPQRFHFPLTKSGYICQCGELRMVRSLVQSIVQMIMRTNTKNLKELSMVISRDEPDYPDISGFSSIQSGISNLQSLHLLLENTPVKDNVRIFIEKLLDLCKNFREMSFKLVENDGDEEITRLLIKLIRVQQLDKFTLKCCSASARRYIEVLSFQKELKYLQLSEIDFTKISVSSLNSVSQCKKLDRIIISDFRGISYNQDMNNLLLTLGLNIDDFDATT
ncbi:12590_t:CDS:2, partial [Dentiscutata heterogama]